MKDSKISMEITDSTEHHQRDALYLFACKLGWRETKDVRSYRELLAAVAHPDRNIRVVAEALLSRTQL